MFHALGEHCATIAPPSPFESRQEPNQCSTRTTENQFLRLVRLVRESDQLRASIERLRERRRVAWDQLIRRPDQSTLARTQLALLNSKLSDLSKRLQASQASACRIAGITLPEEINNSDARTQKN